MRYYVTIIMCVLMTTTAFGQDKELAELLVGIGDSVKQATLNPVEKYNKYKPFERSYLAYSHPMAISQEPVMTGGRITLFHSIGFYSSLPFASQADLSSNVSLEEIHNSESIALLQGQSFQSATFLDSAIKTFGMDYGIIFAPIKNHPFTKNVFVSIGISSTRVSTYHSYTNNGLLSLTEEFRTLYSSEIQTGLDLGVSYVLPYLQASAGYKLNGYSPGVYVNAGVNIPLRIILQRVKKRDDFNRRLKELDNEAEIFDRSNF